MSIGVLWMENMKTKKLLKENMKEYIRRRKLLLFLLF